MFRFTIPPKDPPPKESDENESYLERWDPDGLIPWNDFKPYYHYYSKFPKKTKEQIFTFLLVANRIGQICKDLKVMIINLLVSREEKEWYYKCVMCTNECPFSYHTCDDCTEYLFYSSAVVHDRYICSHSRCDLIVSQEEGGVCYKHSDPPRSPQRKLRR